MIYVGIDVAKDKHDCFITNSVGEVLFNSFTAVVRAFKASQATGRASADRRRGASPVELC